MRKKEILPLYLLFTILTFLPNIIQSSGGNDGDNNSMRFELTHVQSREFDGKPKSHEERFKELIDSDKIRRRQLISRQANNHEQAIALDFLRMAGSYNGSMGGFFATMAFGTPPQKSKLIVDTGSSLTWLHCRLRCGQKCLRRERQDGRILFHAGQSSSFKPLACSSELCQCLNYSSGASRCRSPSDRCTYQLRYLDNTTVAGMYANETVTLTTADGKTVKLHDMLIGCSDRHESHIPNSGAVGLLGLSFDVESSFVLKIIENFSGKFSHCFHNISCTSLEEKMSSYLMLGQNKELSSSSPAKKMQYTKLDLTSYHYHLNLSGISVNGALLKVPSQLWNTENGGNGLTIDSGTTFTLLPELAYDVVVKAFQTHLPQMKLTKLLPDGNQLFHCVNFTESGSGLREVSMPKLAFHFADGARFEPDQQGYIFSPEDNVKCLSIIPFQGDHPAIMGNLLTQNYVWEFDLAGQKLGFAPSTCN